MQLFSLHAAVTVIACPTRKRRCTTVAMQHCLALLVACSANAVAVQLEGLVSGPMQAFLHSCRSVQPCLPSAFIQSFKLLSRAASSSLGTTRLVEHKCLLLAALLESVACCSGPPNAGC